LLAAPDDLERDYHAKRLRKIGEKRKADVLDLLDTSIELADKLAIFCDPKTGQPKSWYHYVYGIAYLRRASARESLQMFGAVLAAGADKRHKDEWEQLMTRNARF
jgi:hypothetical protein